MKILLIGSGGREHTLAWKLKQSKKLSKLYAAPGNDAIAEMAECVNITEFDDIADFCKSKNIDIVVIGPEAPLAKGLADRLTDEKIKVFGPKKDGARLESSKIFAKEFMARHNIPTAKFSVLENFETALEQLKNIPYPVVLKADGLAAGKGVTICENYPQAAETLKQYMQDKVFGTAGVKIVAEEFLEGKEASVMAVTDGENYALLSPSRDHKPLYEGNTGPNTGGMGAYSNPADVTQDLLNKVKTDILDKVLLGLKKENISYCGIIYVGLMLTKDGPKVIEFNCRFGDPETQVILPLLKTDLPDIINACVDKKIGGMEIEVFKGECVCIVMASEGYPQKSVTGKIIGGLEELDKYNDIMVFHAGTKKENGNWINSGGRVLGITAIAADLNSARQKAYEAVSKLHFEGVYYRKDIGLL